MECEELIYDTIRDLLAKLKVRTADPYFREAIMKFTLREISWAMVDFIGQDNRSVVTEHLADVARGISDAPEP